MAVFRYWGAVAALGLSLSPAPALAAAAAVADAAATLSPGGYVWDDAGATGDVSIVVSLTDQRLYVYRGPTLVAVSAVSTGREGNDTPPGEYRILQKQAKHKSNLYDSASMPYMQRLTWDGVAIHAGSDPGYPDSHGCIHVPTAFARKLFGATRLGATVSVTDDPVAAPADDPLAIGVPSVETAAATQPY